MKLLFCRNCEDIIRLQFGHRECICGQTSGRYTDELNAIYSGDHAEPIGISNFSLGKALNNKKIPDPVFGGTPFEAFVVPCECLTFKKVEDKENGNEN